MGSVLCGFAVLGGVTNWLLHSRFCEKVKEKSWAMLAVFLCPYVGYSIYGMWLIVSIYSWRWPSYLKPQALIVLALFAYCSGVASFTLVVAFTLMVIVMFVISFVVTLRNMEGPEKEIEESLLIALFAETMFVICIFSALSLTGAFFKEAANIQMFLQRMIMGEQQQEIIRQKTQNTTLQKKLLQSMLPDAVVDQLEMHNFVIESWEQLRSLSTATLASASCLQSWMASLHFLPRWTPHE